MNLMLKHYNVQILQLSKEVSELNSSITSHVDFCRYKYEYERCFVSIDQLLDRLKFNKIKKMNRDRAAYENGLAYPKPSMAQAGLVISSIDAGNTTRNDSSKGRNDTNILNPTNMGGEFLPSPEQNQVRQSERLRSNNKEGNNNQQGTSFSNNNSNNSNNLNFRKDVHPGASPKKFNNYTQKNKQHGNNKRRR
ncbi:GATA zinc finger domain-containing protein 14-like [Protopterus annectens]|uniref:GATA zinc finger domain-containing protein 14-like n=1 Tax=Protopterus annectens TaxID=7888 RepID=UPI001CF93A35|nr:GATA zinc finger domain-containing protein 14-like [Protopterus annectens]